MASDGHDRQAELQKLTRRLHLVAQDIKELSTNHADFQERMTELRKEVEHIAYGLRKINPAGSA